MWQAFMFSTIRHFLSRRFLLAALGVAVFRFGCAEAIALAKTQGWW